MMGTVIALFIIYGFLILCQSIAMGRFVARQVSGRTAWIQPALVLIGPFIAAFGFVLPGVATGLFWSMRRLAQRDDLMWFQTLCN